MILIEENPTMEEKCVDSFVCQSKECGIYMPIIEDVFFGKGDKVKVVPHSR
jgi:hypothetical protein